MYRLAAEMDKNAGGSEISDFSDEIAAGYYRHFFRYWRVHYHGCLTCHNYMILNSLDDVITCINQATTTMEVREINDNFGYFT